MKIAEIKSNARNTLSGKWADAILMAFVYLIVTFALNLIVNFIGLSNTLLKSVISLIITIISYPLSFGIIASFMQFKDSGEYNLAYFIKYGFSNFKRIFKVLFSTIAKIILPLLLLIISIIFIFTSLVIGEQFINNDEEIVSLLNQYSEAYKQELSQSQENSLNVNLGNIETIRLELNQKITSKIADTNFAPLLFIGLALLIVSSIWLFLRLLYYSLTPMILAKNIDEDIPSKNIVNESKVLMEKKRAKYIGLRLSFIGWYLLIEIALGMIAIFTNSQLASYCEPFLMSFLFPYITLSNIAFYEYLKNNNVKEQ